MADPGPAAAPPLVAEAARKSRVCWVAFEHPDGAVRSRLVWHVWYDEALVVVSGDDAQRLDGITAAPVVEVTMRSKDTGGRLVTWTAAVEHVAAGSERWEEHARALLAVRLNLRDPAATLAEWREEATIVRLTAESLDEGPRPLP